MRNVTTRKCGRKRGRYLCAAIAALSKKVAVVERAENGSERVVVIAVGQAVEGDEIVNVPSLSARVETWELRADGSLQIVLVRVATSLCDKVETTPYEWSLLNSPFEDRKRRKIPPVA